MAHGLCRSCYDAQRKVLRELRREAAENPTAEDIARRKQLLAASDLLLNAIEELALDDQVELSRELLKPLEELRKQTGWQRRPGLRVSDAHEWLLELQGRYLLGESPDGELHRRRVRGGLIAA